VFLQCFREGGVLERATPETLKSFRAFLFGVTRNIALGFEARKIPRHEKQADTGFDPVDPKATEERLSIVFDRAWAESIVREAAVRQAERAEILGEDARRRHELLQLRFHDGLPIREIARRWNEEPRRVHKQYEKARAEFEDALKDVISFHYPGQPEAAAREFGRLVEAMR
jgi:RNA polymerase sigma-70 factor (ECF subfamily)